MDAELTYLFRHQLLRDAAYSLQPPSARAHLHRLALDTLQLVVGEGAAAAPLAQEMASHAAAAAEGQQGLARTELLQRELGYLKRARFHAEAQFWNGDVLRLCGRIVGHECAVEAERADALLARGHIRRRLQQLASAREDYEAAAALPGADAAVARVCRVHAAELRMAQGEAEAAHELERLAGAAAGVGDGRAQMAAWSALSAWHLRNENTRDARSYYTRVYELACAMGNRTAECSTLGNLAIVDYNEGDFAAAGRGYLAAMEVAPHTPRPAMHMQYLCVNYSVFLSAVGRVPEAQDYMRRALAFAREIGEVAVEGMVLTNAGITEYERGDYERAVETYRQGARCFAETGNASRYGTCLINVANSLILLGRLEESAATIEQAIVQLASVGDQPQLATAMMTCAELECESGHIVAAAELAQEALRRMRTLDFKPGLPHALSCKARMELLRGNQDAAETEINEAEHTSPRGEVRNRLFVVAPMRVRIAAESAARAMRVGGAPQLGPLRDAVAALHQLAPAIAADPAAGNARAALRVAASVKDGALDELVAGYKFDELSAAIRSALNSMTAKARDPRRLTPRGSQLLQAAGEQPGWDRPSIRRGLFPPLG